MSMKRWIERLGILAIGGLVAAGCVSHEGTAPREETRQVTLQVEGLASADAADAVKGVLSKQAGVGSVAVDPGAGMVSFTLADSGSIDGIIGALKDAGYTAKEAEHPKGGEHPKEAEHPEGAEHPKEPEHPEHPK